MFRIKFVSTNLQWIEEMRRRFYDCPHTTIIYGNIQGIPRENTVFVSPANSYGIMNGGIDSILNERIFPGVEGSVKNKIASLGIYTALGRPFLPLGSAIFVKTGATSGLIATPTMVSPRSVADTNNAFVSFLTALTMMKKYRESTQQESVFTTLVVTSHCCGYGEMDESLSALQMYQAYNNFMDGIYPYEVDKLDVPDVLINTPAADDEPDGDSDDKILELENRTIDISLHARY